MKWTVRIPMDLPLSLVVLLWIGFVLTGSMALVHYGIGPGAADEAPITWPETSTLSQITNQHHLLIFLHPRCPCSRSTMRQLQSAMTHSQDVVRITAVVYWPENQPREWTETHLVNEVKRLPSAQIVLDRDGKEAKRFGVHTSGHILYYESTGRLLFSGGITPGRGHEGPCTGLDSLIHRLRGTASGTHRVDVFGCPIRADNATDCGEESKCDHRGFGKQS